MSKRVHDVSNGSQMCSCRPGSPGCVDADSGDPYQGAMPIIQTGLAIEEGERHDGSGNSQRVRRYRLDGELFAWEDEDGYCIRLTASAGDLKDSASHRRKRLAALAILLREFYAADHLGEHIMYDVDVRLTETNPAIKSPF